MGERVTQLPRPSWDGNHEAARVLPPPLNIEPDRCLSTEGLEAGAAGSSPDRLLQRPMEGSAGATGVLPPPLAIVPEQSLLSTEELEAGTEGYSPDRLLQRSKEGNTEGMLILPPPRAIAPEQLPRVKYPPATTLMSSSTILPPSPPSPPPMRRIVRQCCVDPKEKQRARRECTACFVSALRSGCCLFAASLAILIAYWSLFPMCTTCEDGALSASPPSSATEVAATASSGGTGGSVPPFSTLRINQLQVRCCTEAPLGLVCVRLL